MKKLIVLLLGFIFFATSALAQQRCYPWRNYPPNDPCYRGGANPPPPPPPPTQSLGVWTILNGIVPVNYNASQQPYFDFPQGVPYNLGVNYFTTDVPGIPTTAKGLTITFKIDVTGNPTFNFHTNPNNDGTNPANARLMIWRNGPQDMSTQTYRYWATDGYAYLAAGGTYVIKADFDPAKWSDVYGQTGAQNPADFASTLRYANRAGITLGGGKYYGHGVFVDQGTGTARLTVTNFGTY